MTDIEFPYKRVYFIGGSLFSVKPASLNITIHFNWLGKKATGKKVLQQTFKEPTYSSKVSGKFEVGRFCDGKVIPEYFPDFIKGLPYNEKFNFAYAGAAIDFNFIDYYAEEKLPSKIGYKKLLISSIKIKPSTTMINQFKSVVQHEKEAIKSEKKGDSLVVIQSDNNGMVSLTYLAGLKKKWTNLSQDIYVKNIDTIKQTFTDYVHESAIKLSNVIVNTYESTGINDYVVFGCAKVHQCPMFMSVKNNNAIGDKDGNGIDDLTDFIDGMYATYNSAIKERLKYTSECHPEINITFINTPEYKISAEQMTKSFLDTDGNRNGKPFDMKTATEKDIQALKKYCYYEPTHLTTSAAKGLAKSYAQQMMLHEPKIKKYMASLNK